MLEDKGYTYQLPSGLYFDTSKSPGYGHLALIDIAGQRETGRVENVEGRKLDKRLRPVAGRGAGRPPHHALGLAVGLGRARLAPGMLGDVDVAARRPLRHPHRRHRPPGTAPRQRDRAERGVPRRRPAVGAVLAAQRVHPAGRAEDREVRRAHPAPGRPGGSRATTRWPTGCSCSAATTAASSTSP